jgi:TolA-binding protein
LLRLTQQIHADNPRQIGEAYYFRGLAYEIGQQTALARADYMEAIRLLEQQLAAAKKESDSSEQVLELELVLQELNGKLEEVSGSTSKKQQQNTQQRQEVQVKAKASAIGPPVTAKTIQSLGSFGSGVKRSIAQASQPVSNDASKADASNSTDNNSTATDNDTKRQRTE